jgi:type IX secretion system PorP/SprF family membrane protein
MIMKNLRIIIVLALSLTTSQEVFGQQEPQFTQYFDNTLFVNPAYAGSRGVMNMTAIHREQWVGFDGRPRSTTFSIHTPLSYESVGVGLTMVNDQAGPVTQRMVYGDFSYSLRFGNSDRKLAFGIKGGLNIINVGTADLTTTTDNDPKLMQNVRNTMNPNFGFGIYYHSPAFFAGVSSPRILEQSYGGVSTTNLERRHFFGIVGGVFNMNNAWKLRPTAQVKLTNGAPVSVDASITAIYKEKIWFGAMYRFDAAVGVFAQFLLTEQFRIGLASDYGTQRIQKYNVGTFEVMLSYDFKFKKNGIRSPRYF